MRVGEMNWNFRQITVCKQLQHLSRFDICFRNPAGNDGDAGAGLGFIIGQKFAVSRKARTKSDRLTTIFRFKIKALSGKAFRLDDGVMFKVDRFGGHAEL